MLIQNILIDHISIPINRYRVNHWSIISGPITTVNQFTPIKENEKPSKFKNTLLQSYLDILNKVPTNLLLF